MNGTNSSNHVNGMNGVKKEVRMGTKEMDRTEVQKANEFRAWLVAQMDEAAQSGKRIYVERAVGPLEAAVVLEFRSNIRPETMPDIRLYAREMFEGKWLLNPEGPAFTTARKLINCHHRLEGLVLAGEMARGAGTRAPAITLTFSFGFPPESVAGMDRGKIRTDSQVAAALGVKVAPKVMSAIRWYIKISAGLPGSHTKHTTGELLEVLNSIRPSVDALSSAISQKHPAPVWGVLLFAHHINPIQVEEFAAALVSKGRDANSPVTTLLEYLDDADSAGGQNGRWHAIHTMYALRAWIANTPLTRFSIPKADPRVDTLIAFLSTKVRK